MRYAVWGAGVRGNLALSFLGKNNVELFIEQNAKLQGTRIMGKPVISFEEYIKTYNDCYIIVSPNDNRDIINTLKNKGISGYSILGEIIY